jgi:lipoprotein signal peptidase
MLAGESGWQRWFFSALAVGVSIALLYWLRKLALATHALLCGGLALILGGAIGNVIDRFEHGYVVDFVQVHWGAAYFPAFNVADSAISIGAALVVLDALREGGRERRAARARKQPQYGRCCVVKILLANLGVSARRRAPSTSSSGPSAVRHEVGTTIQRG